MSTDIHDKIRSEVERRLGIARAATPGPWTVEDAFALVAGCRCGSCYESEPYGRMIPELDGPPRADVSPVLYDHDATYVALHDPADAIRRYEYALKVLDRHAPAADEPQLCRWCFNSGDEQDYFPWPCPEITDLAESLGIDTGGQP